MTDELLDQGVTRLELLAFLRGQESTKWDGHTNRWVRYRAHQVDRLGNLDGLYVRLAYTDHDGTFQDAGWTVRIDRPDVDYNAAAVLRDIDTIIDAAIAHHGADGVA